MSIKRYTKEELTENISDIVFELVESSQVTEYEFTEDDDDDDECCSDCEYDDDECSDCSCHNFEFLGFTQHMSNLLTRFIKLNFNPKED